MSVATARPCSRRNRRSTTSRAFGTPKVRAAAPLAYSTLLGRRAHLHDGPDLDGAQRRRRDLGRPPDGLVEVLAVQQVEPAELLLRLGEGAVGGERLPVPDPNGRRRAAGLEGLTAPEHAGLVHLAVVGGVGLHDLFVLLRAHGGPLLFVVVDQEHVPHALSPLSRAAVRRHQPNDERRGAVSTPPGARTLARSP